MNAFTYNDYRKLLPHAKEKYVFRGFDDFLVDEIFFIMRHDICTGIGDPIRLGLIEKELGIKSTYFFSVDSSFYNLLCTEVSEIVHKLVSFGHDIEIHFHFNKYIGNGDDAIISYLQYQKGLFEKLLNITPKSFSLHNPTKDIIQKFDKISY